jgi:hypothetical protein
MRTAFLALLVLSATLLVSQSAKVQNTKIGDARIEEVGKSPVQAAFNPGGRVRMDLCSSGVHLVGRDDNVVRVSYHPDRNNVKVRLQVFGDQADLSVSDCPSNHFEMTIEVPRSSDLYVRMFAGDLEVSGVAGDKDVELHAGELIMQIGNPADCARVNASVTSGSLVASAFNVSKGGLFRSFEQTGPGKYRVHAHVGAGDLQLR